MAEISERNMSESDHAELHARISALDPARLVDVMLEGLYDWFADRETSRRDGVSALAAINAGELDRHILARLRSRDDTLEI